MFSGEPKVLKDSKKTLPEEFDLTVIAGAITAHELLRCADALEKTHCRAADSVGTTGRR